MVAITRTPIANVPAGADESNAMMLKLPKAMRTISRTSDRAIVDGPVLSTLDIELIRSPHFAWPMEHSAPFWARNPKHPGSLFPEDAFTTSAR